MLEKSKIALPLRWRPMEPADVDECVNIVSAHPVIGPRYGADIDDLRCAWSRLLGSAAMIGAVFEQLDQKRARIVAIGVGIFVRDEFIREIKTPPLLWFGPELARRVMGPDSPVLTDTEVRDANSGDGLNALVWEAIEALEFAPRSDLFHLMIDNYVEAHRGFLFKELITSQKASAEQLQWAVEAGGLFWNPALQRYEKAPPGPVEIVAVRPNLVGITRDLAWPGSQVSTLFDYRPPRFGFSRGEQQLLLMALSRSSGTDQELAGVLHLAVPTVKKTWGSIYRRVTACDQELIPDSANADSGTNERGREKRRRLLAHLREHPEELRLHSRKLLAENLRATSR